MVALLIIDATVEESNSAVHLLLEINAASPTRYNHDLESFHATPRVFLA